MSRIAGLLTLISSAVAAAAALTAVMVYQYGPTGSYSLQQVLLEPELLPILSFNDARQRRFTYDGLIFSYFNKAKQKVEERKATFDQYRELYAVIRGEKSIADGERIETLFTGGNPAALVVRVRSGGTVEVFQEIQFANEGNFYRVLLRGEAEGEWAYFHHPDIETRALEIFAP